MKLLYYFLLCASVAKATLVQPTSSKDRLRIIGGTIARAGEFPFSAAINFQTSNGAYFCGGSLISADYVLTAGQCVENAVSFSITLGVVNLQESNANKVVVSATEFYLHPQYNSTTLANDIGIIKLRLPVSFSEYVSPIVLTQNELPDFAPVVSIGWGQTSDDEAGTVSDLHRVTITSLSNDECRGTYGYFITNNTVCAEGNYNQGSCHGDAGSPLIRYEQSIEATHVGISSFFSGNGCESTDPSGYTRTFPYLDWIKNVTNITTI